MLITLFWNFLLMICNFLLFFSPSKNIQMSTLITILLLINYELLIIVIIIIRKSHNNYCSGGVMEWCLLNLFKLIDFLWVILTLVCSYRTSQMWLTRSHMSIHEIWGKFSSFIFWNFEVFLVSLSIFQNLKKMNLVNLSKVPLLNMWLLVLISH